MTGLLASSLLQHLQQTSRPAPAVLLLRPGGQRDLGLQFRRLCRSRPCLPAPRALLTPRAPRSPCNPPGRPSATEASGGMPASTTCTRSPCCSGEPVPSTRRAVRQVCGEEKPGDRGPIHPLLRQHERRRLWQAFAQPRQVHRGGWPHLLLDRGSHTRPCTPAWLYCWPNPQPRFVCFSLSVSREQVAQLLNRSSVCWERL